MQTEMVARNLLQSEPSKAVPREMRAKARRARERRFELVLMVDLVLVSVVAKGKVIVACFALCSFKLFAVC